jgi:hypothetical protein
MRWAPAILVVVLCAPLVAPTAAAWFWDCAGDPTKPECAKDPQTDVNQILAFARGGHRSLGFAYDGAAVHDYESCLAIDVTPRNNKGQVVVAGLFNPDTAVDIRFEDFWLKDKQDPLVRDAPIFGSNVGGYPLPELDAFAAGWGNATFEVDFEEYPDVVNGPPFDEEDEWNWTAMFFLTKNGIRNNATKAMTRINGAPFDPARPRDVRLEADDWEAHLVLRNHTSNGQPWRLPFNFGGPAVSTVRDDQFQAAHVLPNYLYGGEALVRIEVTAPTLLQTNLRFELYSPSDKSLGNWTLGGIPTATDVRTFTVPLDELLEYRFRVSGTLALASYRISGTMVGPEEATLYFWWEDFTFGHRAVREGDQCRGLVHGDLQEPAPLTIQTPDPRPLALRLVILGVAATILMGLYITKLVMDSVSTSTFLRTFRKS